jgi:hypothetical protein
MRTLVGLVLAMAGAAACGGRGDPLNDIPACRAWLEGARACLEATPLSHRTALEAAIGAARASVRGAPDSADFTAACEAAATDLSRAARPLCPGVSFGSR